MEIWKFYFGARCQGGVHREVADPQIGEDIFALEKGLLRLMDIQIKKEQKIVLEFINIDHGTVSDRHPDGLEYDSHSGE